MPGHDSTFSDTRLWQKIARIAAHIPGNNAGAEFLEAEEIQRTLHDDALRLRDFQGAIVLAHHAMAEPYNQQIHTMYCQWLLQRRYYAVAANDLFLPNYPPRLHPLPRDMIKVGMMPTGMPIGYPLERAACNVAIVGGTGSGKSEFEKPQIVQLGAAQE